MEQSGVKHNITCEYCSKGFYKNFNLKRHIEKSHFDKSLQKTFTCCHCSKSFNIKYSLIRHISKCGKETNRKTVKCVVCEYKNMRANVIEHYTKQHDIAITSEVLKFKNSQSFEDWKTEIEKTSISKFVLTDKCKTAKTLVRYYRCHRDGCYKGRGNNKRNLKKLGSNKINGYCPAKMDVTMTNETDELTVKFVDTHVGHEMELSRIPLSKSDRDNIATQLASKVSFDEVLNSAKDGADQNNPDRLHLLTRKDLYNIEKLYNLSSSVRHSSDAVSIEAWIKEMRESKNYSVVRFCKIQGEQNAGYPELQLEDLLLIVMNDTQLEMLKKFGNNCVCVDSVRSVDKSDFELTTVMVLDDLHQGFPCTFIFSNRSSQTTFKVVFSILRDILECSLHPYVFMSDILDDFYNAWFEVMGPVAFRLFCTWHVTADWKENIDRKVQSCKNQGLLYGMLTSLIDEQDESGFENLLENALRVMESDQDFSEFRSYFMVTYISNKHSWAYCYRRHSGLNRNIHLRKMHETLKHIYHRGKTAKRLDKTINALMKLVRGKRDERLATLNKGKTCSRLSEIRKRHASAEAMKDVTIAPDPAGEGWLVNSASGGLLCRVEVSRPDCRCELRCPDCDTCVHAYACSCPDSSVRWNMCPHIHLLARQTWGHSSEPRVTEDSAEDNADVFTETTECETEQVYHPMEVHQRSAEGILTDQKAKIRQEVEAILGGVTCLEQCQVLERALLAAKAELGVSATPCGIPLQ